MLKSTMRAGEIRYGTGPDDSEPVTNGRPQLEQKSESP